MVVEKPLCLKLIGSFVRLPQLLFSMSATSPSSSTNINSAYTTPNTATATFGTQEFEQKNVITKLLQEKITPENLALRPGPGASTLLLLVL